MPTLDQLQRLLFQDFALENSRRAPLTVLGEHAYGMEQGRIVTARVPGESGGTTSVSEESEVPPAEVSCCPDDLADDYCIVWPGPCGFTSIYDFITVTRIGETCVWEGTGINPDTEDEFTIRLSLDDPALEGCPDDSCGQWRVDFEPRVAWKCYDDGDPTGSYVDTGSGICGGVTVSVNEC